MCIRDRNRDWGPGLRRPSRRPGHGPARVRPHWARPCRWGTPGPSPVAWHRGPGQAWTALVERRPPQGSQ
eukprot:9706801-Alexandrium_andersonii.AAC.1